MKFIPRILRSPVVLSLLGILLLVLVAYPKPALLFQHIQNLINPPVQTQAVSNISRSLPDDPKIVEAWVFENVERDANDYSNWGVIFYFAGPEEVLSIGRGACYARAIVLASILSDKSIPFKLFLCQDICGLITLGVILTFGERDWIGSKITKMQFFAGKKAAGAIRVQVGLRCFQLWQPSNFSFIGGSYL